MEQVSFRELQSDIPSTSYASHGMYYYPAKFIPQAVRFIIEKYTEPGDWVFDPFAGAGTVGIESIITSRNSIVWDLSPLIEDLMEAQTLRINGFTKYEVEKELNDLLDYDGDPFEPDWNNIDYWYPDKVLEVLKQWWGSFHNFKSEYKSLFKLALFTASNKYSWGDDTVPKLFKSKKKTEELNKILEGDWYSAMEETLRDSLFNSFKKMVDFTETAPTDARCSVKGGVDVLDPETQLNQDIDLIVTSPPYFQAQEYIRSIKLELYWLGYSDEEVRELKRKEIPYNDPAPKETPSDTFWDYRKQVMEEKEKLVERYDSYFYSLFRAFEKFSTNLKPSRHMAIFVGNSSLAGIDVPIHRILREHLSAHGLQYEEIYVDEIKNRKLFKGRKNKSPDGMEQEYFLILRK